MNALASAREGSPVIGGLLFAAIIIGLLIWWRIDVRTRPWLPCRTCDGSPRRPSAFREKAWGPCPDCGGTGRRPRSITRRRGP
ncbi:hypothetical protein [Actinomadura madurae]|uniref:hypothetical protein n=1 Tax=Actinomadura madurae TaxID=1993 RepID=UPI0020D1FE00|nr:hypothetical protein [Actinomadura madurae]MCP9947313.1 hypothetical protein [Actinomadura madurae]MCP9964075.1 hypothetical protein [Actinomadura madurae]MCP9976549.1 hypothetical protein [Actinomadura madurae]MCQ0011951.1 hypothetical protein [Actinomadura madurae]